MKSVHQVLAYKKVLQTSVQIQTNQLDDFLDKLDNIKELLFGFTHAHLQIAHQNSLTSITCELNTAQQ